MNVVFSWVAGLCIAATVQLMLANLGIALGLTVLDWSPKRQPTDKSPDAAQDTETEFAFPITHVLGLGVAVSVLIVLGTATLLMVEFSQIAEPRRGAILGIFLWATYWLLFAWLSSTTLSSIANSILGTAIAGVRRLINALRQSLRPPTADLSEVDQAMLRELAAEVSQVAELQQSLPQLLAQQRERLIEEISDRTDLSPDEAKSVVDELDAGTSQPDNLATSTASSSLLTSLNLPNWRQLLQQGLNQVDLSDLDVETLWHHLQTFAEDSQNSQDLPPSAPPKEAQNAEEAQKSTEPLAAIPLDAEEFVSQSPTWSFHPEVLAETFYERIYDPDAAPDLIREQLTRLDRTQFVEWLEARGDLAAERVTAIADQLDQVRSSVMAKVADSAPDLSTLQPALQEVQEKLTAYCRYTNLDVLTPASLVEKVHTVRQEEGLPEPLPVALRTQVDLAPLEAILARRQGMSPDQQQALAAALQTAWGQEDAAQETQLALPQRLTQALSESLRAVDWSRVSLEDLKPELLNQLRSLDIRGELDWSAISGHLAIPTEVKTELTDWLQETGQTLSRTPRRWAKRVGHSTQAWLQQLARQIRHYLQFQDKSAFQPEQMAQDMVHLVKGAIGFLPSPADWPDWSEVSRALDFSDFRAALEQRRDMTIEDIQQVLNGLASAWHQTTHQLQTLPAALWSEAQALVNAELEDLDTVRQQVVARIEATQQTVKAQAAAVKADLQRQADATRKQVAIAAWWLFLSLLSSGAGAAIAGWIAVQY